MNRVTILSLVVLSAAIGVGGLLRAVASPGPSSQAQGGTRIVSAPPRAWSNQGVFDPTEFDAEKLSAEMRLDTVDKLVTFIWSFDGGAGRKYYHQRVALAFWPTAAASVGPNVLIAGKDSVRGSTIVEKWTFTISALPNEDEEPVIARSRLYKENEQGRKIVRLMYELKGASNTDGKALVLFDDSDDLYSFDVATKELSLIYTSSTVLALASDDWRYVWAGEHPVQGYVYVLQRDLDIPSNEDPLVLLDLNKDSLIDEWHQLSATAWQTLLGPPPTWTKVF